MTGLIHWFTLQVLHTDQDWLLVLRRSSFCFIKSAKHYLLKIHLQDQNIYQTLIFQLHYITSKDFAVVLFCVYSYHKNIITVIN